MTTFRRSPSRPRRSSTTSTNSPVKAAPTPPRCNGSNGGSTTSDTRRESWGTRSPAIHDLSSGTETRIAFDLPFPPSANHYYRRGKGRTHISSTGRQYLEILQDLIRFSRCPPTIQHPIAVELLMTAPNRARRDLDNFEKALLDALTRSGVWADDSLIHDKRTRWVKPATAPGRVQGIITDLEPDDA